MRLAALGRVSRLPRAVFTRLRALKRPSLRTTRIALLIVLPLLLAVPLAAEGYSVATWRSSQVDYYNQGLAALNQGLANQDPTALQQSVQLFQKSLGAYQSQAQESTLDRWLHGAPSSEDASLAYLKEGIALLAVGEINSDNTSITQAVEALKNAIRLNPGVPYSDAIASGDINRLAQEALPPKYDLELLFKNHPEQQQQQSKQGQGKQGQPKPGQKNAPGQNPQNLPGHGTPGGI